MRDLLYSVSILNYLDLSSHVESCDFVSFNSGFGLFIYEGKWAFILIFQNVHVRFLC